MVGLSLVLAQANSSRIYYWLPNHHLEKSTFNDVFLQQTTYNVTRRWRSKNMTSARKQGNREIAVSFSRSQGNPRAESLVEINSCDYSSPSDTSLFCCPVHKCLESSGAMVSRFLIEVYFDSTVTSLLMWWYPNRNILSKILCILSVPSSQNKYSLLGITVDKKTGIVVQAQSFLIVNRNGSKTTLLCHRVFAIFTLDSQCRNTAESD